MNENIDIPIGVMACTIDRGPFEYVFERTLISTNDIREEVKKIRNKIHFII